MTGADPPADAAENAMLSNQLNALPAGILLALYQFLAILPALFALDPKGSRAALRSVNSWLTGVGIIGAVGAGLALQLGTNRDPGILAQFGYYYASVLHLSLIISGMCLAPQLLLLVWPRGGAVAVAAYREGWRQPTFWVVALFGALLIAVSMVLPYFTFGDEYKMMKQLGFDIVMLGAALFGVLAAGTSIYEEIEGRTAITVMSKPITRRQFLVGKFVGILMASGALTLVLGWFLNYGLHIKPVFDKLEEVKDAMPLEAKDAFTPALAHAVPGADGAAVASGVAGWFGEVFAHHTGLLLGFGQVMVLIAIASALATRLPFVVNVVLCLMVFFLGHLSPVLVQVTQPLAGDWSSGLSLVSFVAQLFDAVLPALEFFNMGPAIIRDNPLAMADFGPYVLTVFGYSLLYVAIWLLVGLILFEDRDLA